MERVRLTPLTLDEQQFAADNYDCLQWAIQNQCLEKELTDIAALGYIHAVKKWFARPDLRKWSFRTIVNQTVRSHISNERKRQKSRIQTVSLDDVIPGTDGLTYGASITIDNIGYLYRTEVQAVQIQFGIDIPEAARMRRGVSVEVETLISFLGSVHKTMSLAYPNTKTAATKAGSLRNWQKKNNRTDFAVYRLGETIYIEKITKKAGAKK